MSEREGERERELGSGQKPTYWMDEILTVEYIVKTANNYGRKHIDYCNSETFL